MFATAVPQHRLVDALPTTGANKVLKQEPRPKYWDATDHNVS